MAATSDKDQDFARTDSSRAGCRWWAARRRVRFQAQKVRTSRVPAPDVAEFRHRQNLTDLDVHEFGHHLRWDGTRLPPGQRAAHARLRRRRRDAPCLRLPDVGAGRLTKWRCGVHGFDCLGSGHANPQQFSEMVAEDRDLRLRGYDQLGGRCGPGPASGCGVVGRRHWGCDRGYGVAGRPGEAAAGGGKNRRGSKII
jgi:hypothetical protein